MSSPDIYTLAQLAKLKIHFIGLGGAGMSGIARIMLAKGFTVSGSDKTDSPVLTSLKALGAKVFVGHIKENLADAQLVIISAAITENNPELVAAKQGGIPVVARANALAWLMSESTSVAVAGTHGKTTTTAMLTVALQSAGADPSFAIGGTINNAGTNAHSGSGSIFVAEADESDGSFLAYKPSGAIITNVELDHVDHFADEEAVFAVFEQFVDSIKPGGFLVACGDDSGVKHLLSQIKRSDLKILLYGEDSNNDFRIDRINLAPTTSSAALTITGRKIGELNLAVAGKHNLLNAVAAFAAGSAYLLGWSSFLSVSSVSIQGSEANLIINNKLIQSGVQPQVGSKLARVDIRAIKQSLTELDWIEDADISRNWFSKQIKINVIERVAIARSISTQNTLINFDSYGSIFTPTSATQIAMQNKLPQVTTQSSTKADLSSVAKLLNQIPADLNYLVTELESISVSKSGSIIMNTRINANLVRISWGRAQEVGQKSTVLKALLKLPENQQIKQVDLSQPSSPIIS